jgi:hypothetical protein
MGLCRKQAFLAQRWRNACFAVLWKSQGEAVKPSGVPWSMVSRGKRHRKIIQEAKHLPLPLREAIQQIASRALFGSSGLSLSLC